MEEEGFKVNDRRQRDAAPGGEGDRAASDLSSVFIMFAGWALVALGESPDPVAGERPPDLRQAREAIEILRLLRDKTAGNRTEQETALLEELLYDVQMRYVRVAKAAGG